MRAIRWFFVLVLWSSAATLIAQAVNVESGHMVMDADAIARITTAVVVLCQLAKSVGVTGIGALFSSMVLSGVGVALWAYSTGSWSRTTSFQIFEGYCIILAAAAGVFNLINKSPQAVMAVKDVGSRMSDVITGTGDGSQK